MKYIKIPQDEFFKMDGNDFLIFRLLLSLADDNGKCECSIRDISRDTGISFYNIRKLLLKSKRYKITNRTSNKSSIFEIIGYNNYIGTQSSVKSDIPSEIKSENISIDINDKEYEFNIGMKEAYPRVMQLKHPLTYNGYVELQSKYTAEEIKDVLTRMDNYKPLLSKYIDAKRTIINWIKISRRQ